jgi:hypothetical protein
MAYQEPGADGAPWRREPVVTRGDRGRWQRQAMALLEHLVHQHAALPAINWYLTWVGNLHGFAGSEVRPGAASTMFTAWSTALAFDRQRELPGTGGLVRAHGRAHWGSVAVSVTASVRPSGVGGAVPDLAADQAGTVMPTTCNVIPAVDFLARTMRLHDHIDAVTWLVRPSGELSARVSVPGSPHGTTSLFRLWLAALDLDQPQVTAVHYGAGPELRAQGYSSENVRVTLEATVARTRSHHQAAGSAQPVQSEESPRPDSAIGRLEVRPGAVARRRATRPLQHPPMRGSERHGPAPRPS